MSKSPPDAADAASSVSVPYAVPRRFDLPTLFAVSFAYALLFGVMRLLGISPEGMMAVGIFFTVVGVAQALFFKGKKPRAASIIAGCLYFSLLSFAVLSKNWSNMDIFGVVFASLCPGCVLGYLGGLVVSSVFLIADGVRQLARLSRERRSRSKCLEDDQAE